MCTYVDITLSIRRGFGVQYKTYYCVHNGVQVYYHSHPPPPPLSHPLPLSLLSSKYEAALLKALSPFEKFYVSRSLSRLFDSVNQLFAPGSRTTPTQDTLHSTIRTLTRSLLVQDKVLGHSQVQDKVLGHSR